jgi:hypothetical protein
MVCCLGVIVGDVFKSSRVDDGDDMPTPPTPIYIIGKCYWICAFTY